MYEGWWRGFAEGWLARYRDRPEAVDYHRGTHGEFLRRHEQWVEDAVQTGPDKVAAVRPFLLKRVADARSLRCAWDKLRRKGGQAPGPNGHRYEDLDESEVWSLLRALGKAIRDATYRPGPERECKIPKRSGQGYRTLRIRNIEDRVVEKSVVLIVQPLLDPYFAEFSFGYRPGRDRRHALAMAERLTVAEGRPVWVCQDLRDAYDHVSLARVRDVVGKRLPVPGLRALIRRIIDTPTKKGLRQGGPLSPLLLNMFLDHLLDRRWSKPKDAPPLMRVADDLLILCRSMEEAQSAHAKLQTLLQPTGMSLKHSPEKAIRDLSAGEPAHWLGFMIGHGGDRLAVRLADDCWDELHEHLALAHTEPDAPLRAVASINGWVDQMGPAYSITDRQHDCQRVIDIAHQHGFDEIPGLQDLLDRYQESYARWSKLRQAGQTIPTEDA